MYVYVQGRRLQRRSASAHSTPRAGSGALARPAPRATTGRTERLRPDPDSVDGLVSKSLALCEGTDLKLRGFEAVLQNDPSTWSRPGTGNVALGRCRPWTGRAPVCAHALAEDADGFAPAVTSCSWAGRTRMTLSAPRVEREQHLNRSNELTHGGDPEEVVRMLQKRELAHVKQSEALEHRAQWLDKLLREEREEKRQLLGKVKQLQALLVAREPEHPKAAAWKRRYHFAVDGDTLDSSVGGKQDTREMAYFEVRLEPPHAPARGAAEGPAPRDSAENEASAVRWKRFAFSDRSCDALEGGGAGGTSDGLEYNARTSSSRLVDPERVSAWLGLATPRSAADAVPMLILAKDLLRRLVSKQVVWVEDRIGRLEERARVLQEELVAARSTLAAFEASKAAEMEAVREQGRAALAEARGEFQARFGECVKKLTPLAIRNAMLQARVKVSKEMCREAMAVAPAEAVQRWNTEQRIAALRMLLEMDKVNFFLPEDFASTLRFSEMSMMHWCQVFIKHFEERFSGTGAMLQVVCDMFRANKETLARQVVVWYNWAQCSLDPSAVTALAPDKVEQAKSAELLRMRNSLIEGDRDIWDLAALILQVPKAVAFSELLGFPREEEEHVLALWPLFLAFLSHQHSSHVLVAPPPSLTAAWRRVEESDAWPQVSTRVFEMRHGLLNMQTLPPSLVLNLADMSALILDLYQRRALDIAEAEEAKKECKGGVATRAGGEQHGAGLGGLGFARYVKHALLKQNELRSVAMRQLLRIHNTAAAQQHDNARVRVFAHLAGMTDDPNKYFYPCSEHFMTTFWQRVIEKDLQRQSSFHLKDLAAWMHGDERLRLAEGGADAVWDQGQRQGELEARRFGEREQGGGQGGSGRAGIGRARGWGRGGGRRGGIEEGGRRMRDKGRALGDRAVEMKHVAEALVEAVGQHLIVPFETRHTFGQLPSVSDVCVLLEPARVAATHRCLLPLEDSDKASFQPSFDDPGASFADPRAGHAQQSDRESPHPQQPQDGGGESGDTRGHSLAASGQAQGDHVASQGGEAVKNGARGRAGRDTRGDKSETHQGVVSFVSFDLASWVALEAWYRLLEQYRGHVCELWQASELQWDNGANLASPDIAQLRLFLGQACNLAFEEDDLLDLYLEMSAHDDTIEREHAANTIARWLHKARALSHAPVKALMSSNDGLKTQ